ncbi:EamA family transporter RarD [Rarobacter faecitabidus]|uniref:EamA family transporter RarD n=1 Tax=Rarobacter faecitabidus TaxID=13243 RepID=UPI001FE9CDB5|nr:EamA family transporter RarD [Rarobacter faecitabidus]
MPSPQVSTSNSSALLAGAGSYVLWGVFPLYFHLLNPAGAFEVIVHRAWWGMLTCIAAILLLKQWRAFKATVRDRSAVWRLAIAGGLIAVNWTVYVYAVQSGHTVDAALGYFINPLVTVALGRVVLGERLTRLRACAVALGLVAIVVLVIGMGRLPWVSLVLALSFGLYSLAKKDVASRVAPLSGMAIETAVITPVLLVYYGWLVAHGAASWQDYSSGNDVAVWAHLLLLIGSGPLTVLPLYCFAWAARGLPLSVMGLLQYITPVMQLLIGVLVFHEPMATARWIGTAIVWLALIVLTIDLYRSLRAQPEAVRTGKT